MPAADRPRRAWIAAAVLLACLPMVRYRFVERPDLVLMLCLGFTIYALDAYRLEGRRWIYTLPLVHVLWANMHPTVILTLVPFGAVLVGGFGLHLVARVHGRELPGTPSAHQLRRVATVLVLSLLGCLVNPRGAEILTLPFRLAGMRWAVQEITELQRPPVDLYPGVYILAGLLFLALVAAWRMAPIVPALLVLPFAYLGLTGVRLIFLFTIVGAPVLARTLAALAVSPSAVRLRRPAFALAVVGVVLSTLATGLAVAQLRPLADGRKTAGLGVDARFVPEGEIGRAHV